MANQSLSEQVKAEIQGLVSDLSDLQSAVRLGDIRDSVEDLGTSVSGMDGKVASIRELVMPLRNIWRRKPGILKRIGPGSHRKLRSCLRKKFAILSGKCARWK